MKIKTGKGTITLTVLLAIWFVSAIASLPGLAISPILGDLNRIFPKATDLEIQMLTSLPSLLIIPFVLLSGRLSVGRDKLRILTVGLAVFFLSGVACIFAKSMAWLIVISCILGIGAGMVIPLSTGLVVDYFTGDYRVRQLGYSSAINNLTLVLATVVAGYLADVNWHLPFLVYTLPGVSLALSFFLRRGRSTPEPEQSIQMRHKMIDRRKLVGLMLFYFFATYAVLVVTFYASFLVDDYKIDSSFSGVLISLFFLAIMVPGLFIDKIIRRLTRSVNLVSLALICAGLLCVGIFRDKTMLVVGVLCAGFGYGVIQPVIYDDRPAALGDAGAVVRDGDELSGRDGLSLYRGPFPASVRNPQRPFPVFLQCGAGAGARARHVPPPGRFHSRTRRILLQKLAETLGNNVKRFIFVLKSHFLRLSRDEKDFVHGSGGPHCGRLRGVRERYALREDRSGHPYARHGSAFRYRRPHRSDDLQGECPVRRERADDLRRHGFYGVRAVVVQ